MDKYQKRNFRILIVAGLLYFILFIFPNASQMGSDNPIVYLHTDEYVTYPIVERMLEFGPDFSTTWGRLIIYGDYHYGYPFYFFSMLSLLPMRLIQGKEFFSNIPFNILVLRQMISVLPMILTAGVLTYTATRFEKLGGALFTFLFVLTIPAVVRQNMHWWHPDALMMLAIALTFLFLQLDKQRLGKHFYYAAAACGIASAIKLMGFFFFLAIPVYLIISWKKKNHSTRKIILSAAVFVCVMLLVIIISNPFLFYKAPREEMIAVQTGKTDELREGYAHEESLYYSLGPKFWRWTLTISYGDPKFPLLLILLLIPAVLVNPDEDFSWILLAWTIPIGIYLMWFVAPKPDHYLLPLMLPLYATVFSGVKLIQAGWRNENQIIRWISYGGMLVLAVVLTNQWLFHLNSGIQQYLVYFSAG